MPIKWNSKIILFKPESSYGVDPTPTGSANAILMTGVSYSPMEGQDISRDLDLPYLAAQGKIPVGLRVRLRGRVELQGSGTAGTAPAWGPLLRACGVAEGLDPGTSVTYAPISDGMESGTLYFWVGTTMQIVKGVRGNVSMAFSAQGLPYLEFELTGIYADPAEVARVTPDLSDFVRPEVVSSTNTPTFTINGVSMIMRSFSMALNNQVVHRLLVGAEQIIIPDRLESISSQVEAVPLGTINPFTLSQAGTQVPVVLVHGTNAGRIATLTCPTVEIGRMPDYSNQDKILEWNLSMTPLPATGNDQWSLALT